MLDLIRTYWLYFLVGQYPNGPLGGLALTLVLAALALVLALPVGVILGLAGVSAFRALRWPVTALVYVVRGIPLLLVIFWAYFFLPNVTGHKTAQFSTMLIALVLSDGIYLAEIVHAGIRGVPRGQHEAAHAGAGLRPRDAPGDPARRCVLYWLPSGYRLNHWLRVGCSAFMASANGHCAFWRSDSACGHHYWQIFAESTT